MSNYCGQEHKWQRQLLCKKSRMKRGGKKHLTQIKHTKPLVFSRKENPIISIAVVACEILIASRADA